VLLERNIEDEKRRVGPHSPPCGNGEREAGLSWNEEGDDESVWKEKGGTITFNNKKKKCSLERWSSFGGRDLCKLCCEGEGRRAGKTWIIDWMAHGRARKNLRRREMIWSVRRW